MKSTKRKKDSGKPRKRAPQRKPAVESKSIEAALREAGRPLALQELQVAMDCHTAAARKRLSQQIDALLHTGELLRNRREEFCLRARLPLIVGTVAGHRDGHGFLHPEDRSAPIVLPYRQMREVMHGDRIAVRISGTDQRGRPEGAV